MRQWTTREEIRLRSMEGMTTREVASALGRSSESVGSKARRLGVKLAPSPRLDSWPESTRNRALRHLERGLSCPRVSQITGVPLRTLQGWAYADQEAA